MNVVYGATTGGVIGTMPPEYPWMRAAVFVMRGSQPSEKT